MAKMDLKLAIKETSIVKEYDHDCAEHTKECQIIRRVEVVSYSDAMSGEEITNPDTIELIERRIVDGQGN